MDEMLCGKVRVVVSLPPKRHPLFAELSTKSWWRLVLERYMEYTETAERKAFRTIENLRSFFVVCEMVGTKSERTFCMEDSFWSLSLSVCGHIHDAYKLVFHSSVLVAGRVRK